MSRPRKYGAVLLACLLVVSLSVKCVESATLTVQFPSSDLAPPGPSDVYTFLFMSPTGGIPAQFQFRFVAANYSNALVIPNAIPTSFYNVTVVINNSPLPTRSFFSGPDPPTNLEARVISSNTTVVSWAAPNLGGVQKYRLQLLSRDSSGNISKGEPIEWAEKVIRIAPLIPGGEYSVEVVSLFGALTSDPVRTTFIQFPLAPKNFRTVATLTNESAVTVQWDQPEGAVDSYYVSLASASLSNDTLVPGTVLTATFQNLRPGEFYQVAISSVRGNWTSPPVVINATTNPLPPADIRQVSSNQDPRTLRIAWTAPLVNSGPASYRVTLNSTEIPPLNTSENQATWSNLVPGSAYSASVESFVLGSDGPVFSKPLSKVLHTGIDSTFVVTAVPSAPELTVETTDPAVRFLEANATSEDSLPANGEILDGRMIYFRDLVGGTHYLIYVKLSYNDVESIAQFEKLTYPLPPLNVSINASQITPESVLLEWARPINTRLQGLQVLYNKLDDSLAQPANATVVTVPDSGATTFNLTDLTAGAKYSFRMRSVIEDVNSMETEPVLQCTRPPKPLGVTVKAMSVKLLLNLTRPSNTTKYYRVRLLNMDHMEQPPRTIDTRNDSAIVQIAIPVDYLGAKYEVRVSSYMCDLSSEVVTTVVNSLPPVLNLVRPPTEITQTSIKVGYQSSWPFGRSIFTRYAFQISGMPPKYVLPNDAKAQQSIEFTNLVPGTKYTISTWTERGNVQSEKKSMEVQLKPDNVTEMNATKITNRSIAFQWSPPNGTITQYQIGYNNTEPVFTNSTSWVFSSLLPYTIYSIYVAAWSGMERSSTLTRFYTTLEDKPGRVRYFNLSALRPFKLLARWDPPEQPNGILTGYMLDFRENNSVDASWTQLTFNPNVTSHVLTLEPGKSYVLRIAPVNSIGIGPAQDGFMTMPLGPPVLSRTAARPTEVATSKNTITLQFNRDFFLDSNGDIVNYTVVVTEQPMQNLSRDLPSWRDIHDLPVWPPYQAMEYFNPFDGQNKTKPYVLPSSSEPGGVQVIVGSEANCDDYRGTYCNGPLKENTRYYVKLRAFASMSEDSPLFTDTIYTEALVTEAASTSSALGIVLGVCIPIVLVVLLGLSLVLMRKHNWGPFVKRARKAVGKTAVEDKISITESISEKSRPVKLKDFAEHVRIMTADSDFKFSEEYEDLKHVGRDQSCVAADFPVNRAKNRFTNILPYDHSRVKLMPTDDEEGTDYINANYMPGFNSPREFIVTQGPLPSTRDDFWRMIWEQNCRAVVMLTRCVEKGREKCDHYWPYDTDAVVYGDVDVTVMNETQTAEWTLREFRVAKNDEPARSVRHFHFTGWPDFGVPERPQTLIKFVRAFRERIFTDVKPIVVHCSAGVGRSGTFIALDRLLQQIRISDTVDIFGMVCEMRKERVWMVQTEQQYICIHQCLLCVMEGRENEPGQFDTGIHENPCYEISDDEGIVESGPF